MKDVTGFVSLLVAVWLVAVSYQTYHQHLFRTDLDLLYKPKHYKLTQMSSESMMCTDSHGDLCVCGHCK